MPAARSNAEIARRALASWSRGDVEETLRSLDREVEWHVTMRLPDMPLDKDVYNGREEVRALWETLRSVWDSLTLEIEEVITDSGDVLLARVRFRGTGISSGVEVDRVVYYVMVIRDERLARIQPFDELPAARHAAGIDE